MPTQPTPQQRYNRSPKGRARSKKYRQSEKGKALRRRWNAEYRYGDRRALCLARDTEYNARRASKRWYEEHPGEEMSIPTPIESLYELDKSLQELDQILS